MDASPFSHFVASSENFENCIILQYSYPYVLTRNLPTTNRTLCSRCNVNSAIPVFCFTKRLCDNRPMKIVPSAITENMGHQREIVGELEVLVHHWGARLIVAQFSLKGKKTACYDLWGSIRAATSSHLPSFWHNCEFYRYIFIQNRPTTNRECSRCTRSVNRYMGPIYVFWK